MEIVITLALAIIFLFFLSNTLKKVSKRPKRAPVAVKETPKKVFKAKEIEKRREEEVKPLVWGRDPFVLIEKITIYGGVPIALSGILRDRKQSKAMINDEIYKIGDKIGNIELIDIKENSIIIRKDAKTREISLD